jgi:hypothetical protein
MSLSRALSLASLLAVLAGCGATAGRQCLAEEYVHSDRRGGPLPDGGSHSEPVGDGGTYLRCATDADCCEPDRPYCRTLGLYQGGDYSCNGSVRVCDAQPRNDCPLSP